MRAAMALALYVQQFTAGMPEVEARGMDDKEWKTIDTAPTIGGQRIRVGHNLDASSMKTDSRFKTTAVFDSHKLSWDCSAAFVCVDDRLRWQPTHWLPEPPSQAD